MIQVEATQDTLTLLDGPYRLAFTDTIMDPVMVLARTRAKGSAAIRFMGTLDDARRLYEYGVFWRLAQFMFGTVKRPMTAQQSVYALAQTIHTHFGGCNEQCVEHCQSTKGRI